MVIIWLMMVNNIWLVVWTPLKNMSSSMGRMTSHIWYGKKSKCVKPPTSPIFHHISPRISTGWQHLLLRSPASIPLRFLPGFYQLRGVPELCTAASEKVEIHWENAKRGETQREIYEKWLEIVKKIDKWLEWDFETIFCEKSGLKVVKFAGENLPKGMQSLQKRLSESCQDTRHVGRPPEWTAEKVMRTSDKLSKGYC